MRINMVETCADCGELYAYIRHENNNQLLKQTIYYCNAENRIIKMPKMFDKIQKWCPMIAFGNRFEELYN